MKLLDAIFLVGQMPEGSCICSRRPFHQSAEAVIIGLTSEHRVPASTIADGYEYFLEQDGVQELLEFASTKRTSERPRPNLLCTAPRTMLTQLGSTIYLMKLTEISRLHHTTTDSTRLGKNAA